MGKQIIKPHLQKFFETKKIADEPALNKDGFWKPARKTTADEIRKKMRHGKLSSK